jgi:hypothetical protein
MILSPNPSELLSSFQHAVSTADGRRILLAARCRITLFSCPSFGCAFAGALPGVWGRWNPQDFSPLIYPSPNQAGLTGATGGPKNEKR